MAVVLVWAALFFPHLFLGQRVVFADASYYRPFAELSRARWHESHERSSWNPYVFMGLESVASFADPRPQYLPDALIDVSERLHEPGSSPQLWLLLAHLAGTLALLVLARRLWGADPWSGTAGALVWLLAVPILGPFAHGFDAQLLADALIPVLLLCTQAIITASAWPAVMLASLGVALALGLQCLHGHPQILVYSSMLLVLFAAQQAGQSRRWPRLLPWAGAVALGAAIGAAVWWPALIYSASSSRGGIGGVGIPMAVVAKYSYRWRDLLSLFWAQAVGFGRATYWGGMQVQDNSPYLGAVGMALAFAGFRRAPGDGASRFWWTVFAACVVLALGSTLGTAFEWLHAVVPFWSRFRVVSYVMILATVAFALLVARGASRALAPRDAGGPPSRTGPALIVLAVIALAGLAIVFTPLREAYVSTARSLRPGLDEAAANTAATWAGYELAALAAAVAAACLLLTRARAGSRVARIALVALVALDLAVVAIPDVWRSSGSPSRVAPPPPPLLASVAARDPHARVYVGAAEPVAAAGLAMGHYAEAYTNFWVSWRVRSLTGNHGAFPAVWQTVMERQLTRSANVLRAWGVSYYDLDRSVPLGEGDTPLAEDARSRVFRLPGALGRVYAVPAVVALPDVAKIVFAMQHPDFNPASVAVTTDAAVAGEYPGATTAAIEWVRDEPERLEFAVSCADRAFVVVADSYFEGWTALLDGMAVPIAQVNLLARGVAVPAGTHRLEMRYETAGLRVGVLATRWGLAIWLALLLGWGIAQQLRQRLAFSTRAS